MGHKHNRAKLSLAGKDKAAPPAADEEQAEWEEVANQVDLLNQENSALKEELKQLEGKYGSLTSENTALHVVRNVLQEKLNSIRLKQQKTLAMSADADEAICKLKARNEQVMMTPLASGPPAATFKDSSCYGNQAPVPLGRMTMQEQQNYAHAAGVSYRFASSSSHTNSFDLSKFPLDAEEGDSDVPGKATGSCAPSMAGKKSCGSELGLVVEQTLRLWPKKEEVVEAPLHDDDDAGTLTVDDIVGGGCIFDDVVSCAGKKQGDAS